ncbi:Signal peptidase I [hydrothermal vent metagenome]|uniref:signal peptidase I n=1 Tax=hydrothermal vent metagenome TaxID=652676 RepID=A0A3B1E5V0_9ZZZZ
MLSKIYNWSGTWTGTIVIVLGIIFFIAQAFVIPSGSMKNTLLVGDMLFVKKFSYGIPTPTIPWLEVKVLPDFNNNGHLIEGDKPQRGDIVVFRYPDNHKVHYVKRCIATGGDIVALQNKHLLLLPKEGDEFVKKNYPKENIVTIKNKLWVIDPYKLKHPGIHNDNTITKNNTSYIELFDMSPTQIPKGEFFMMGDNRDHSNDSRFWGTVPYRYIVGTPWFIYFSWDKDKKIRWDRVFRTVKSLENDVDSMKKTTHQKGIY